MDLHGDAHFFFTFFVFHEVFDEPLIFPCGGGLSGDGEEEFEVFVVEAFGGVLGIEIDNTEGFSLEIEEWHAHHGADGEV